MVINCIPTSCLVRYDYFDYGSTLVRYGFKILYCQDGQKGARQGFVTCSKSPACLMVLPKNRYQDAFYTNVYILYPGLEANRLASKYATFQSRWIWSSNLFPCQFADPPP